MSIRIQLLPTADRVFADRVRDAIQQVCPNGGRADAGGILAPGEAELRKALAYIRAAYPDVWIRRQDPLASVDGIETWYAFRDEVVRTLDRAPAGRR